MNRNPTVDGTGGRDENERSSNYWSTGAAVVGGIATVIGGIAWLASGSKDQNQTKKPNAQNSQQQTRAEAPQREQTQTSNGGVWGWLSSIYSTPSSERFYSSGKVARTAPPENRCITNMNSLLEDIHVRYIQLRDDDFQLHYKVFDRLFQHLHKKMKDVDPYYRKYSSTVQFAGSHYDNLRIKKPDEFDMDIVIGLPLNFSESPNPNESDIRIESQAAGYVQLRMGVQFQKLPMRDGIEWQNNKAAYLWMDSSNYLCRSKFLDWFKKVCSKALNTFQHKFNKPIFFIDGVEYEISKSESGPAFTLFIKNEQRGFKLDVDLVPALKFPETRWPISGYYRQIPKGCCKNTWMVVGKPNKGAPQHDQERSFRIALHNQERELMHDSYNLRQAVRLIKKLRDEQGMKKIASYYIKTLFFWEIVHQNNRYFWRQNPAFLFKHMVRRLHAALVDGKIKYFWNSRNNLIENVDEKKLSEYADKLVPVMQILDNPDGNNYKMIAKYLLSPREFKEYNEKVLHI